MPCSHATTEVFVEIWMETTAVIVPLHMWESIASYVCTQTAPLTACRVILFFSVCETICILCKPFEITLKIYMLIFYMTVCVIQIFFVVVLFFYVHFWK